MRYKGVILEKRVLAMELKGLEQEFCALERMAWEVTHPKHPFGVFIAYNIDRLFGLFQKPTRRQ